MREIQSILMLLARRREFPAVLVTLVQVTGSAYRKPGARLLWFADGTRCGSISGGCLEEDVIQHAGQVLATGRPRVLVYATANENDLVWGTGTGCEGSVRLLLERIPIDRPDWIIRLRANYEANQTTILWSTFEGEAPGTSLAAAGETPAGTFHNVVPPPQRLIVFGAGDDVQPLANMVGELGWRLTLVDARPAYATPERFPAAARILTTRPPAGVEQARFDDLTPAIVMTHRYRDDCAILRALLLTAAPYIGVLGPRKRTERLLAEIEADGYQITAGMRDRLHAPVGLDLGGSTPEAIALAVLAEVQARLFNRTAISLRDRAGPVHG